VKLILTCSRVHSSASVRNGEQLVTLFDAQIQSPSEPVQREMLAVMDLSVIETFLCERGHVITDVDAIADYKSEMQNKIMIGGDSDEF
jgi:hypothetical protein